MKPATKRSLRNRQNCLNRTKTWMEPLKPIRLLKNFRSNIVGQRPIWISTASFSPPLKSHILVATQLPLVFRIMAATHPRLEPASVATSTFTLTQPSGGGSQRRTKRLLSHDKTLLLTPFNSLA